MLISINIFLLPVATHGHIPSNLRFGTDVLRTEGV
jgi:hypothetical protein